MNAKRFGSLAMIIGAMLAYAAGTARADDGRFFLFVSSGDAPSQPLVESAWRESQRLEPGLSPDVARERIGKVYPRLFGAARQIDKTTLEGDLRAGKAAFFATDFALAETHLGRAIQAAFDSPEVVSGSASIMGRLADAAALRYTNALARKVAPDEAKALVAEFVRRFPGLAPTPTEHGKDVLDTWDAARKATPTASLTVSVVPNDLQRSGTCRVLLNGDELGSLPMPGPATVPTGEHFVQVRCGLQAGWLQRVTLAPGATALSVPVRAMVAARADVTSGGIVLVSPEEGDSAALVDAISRAAGFDGAVVVRPGAPRRAEFGVWRPNIDAPTLAATGTMGPDGITDVRGVHASTGGEDGDGLSPWPFVIAGAGVAALGGGIATNVAYLDDRDAGAQDLDATPSVILYGVGGALVVTGVVLFILDVTDDSGTAAVKATGPGTFAVRF